ncbi:hypothetical protein BDZ85DRAFT_279024 [Elsinoe ampelina]|uniref:Vacuolar membrane-associated protein IML1 n=1 Tax=Elsinoe ampelina TaxID=302913 RepID=A0A6A6GN11_9PEZI|nr:hypothetical protein BDZ85DRAFT_279024 [Elsinoe ampelina]
MAIKEKNDFEVVIVGGGIAGLSAAITLRGPGRRITILGKSRMNKEVGALISFQPNAQKIVESWGIDEHFNKARPLGDTAFQILDVNGDVRMRIPLSTERYGANRVMYHRQDLHSALKAGATSTDLPGPPAVIKTASKVVSCDCDAGIVTLEDGTTVQGDLVIGADGIHSPIRASLLSSLGLKPVQPLATGLSAYRVLLDTASMPELDVPSSTFTATAPITTMMMAHDRRVVMAPARGGDVFGLVCLVPDAKMNEDSHGNSWTTPSSVSECADDVALWQLRDIDPLPTWTKGRTILIGDAAHAMLPTQGQGASQSIEDAEALQAFFRGVEGKIEKEEIERRLKEVVDSRIERASLIQAYSRQQAQHATAKGETEIKMNPVEFMDYNCGYAGALDWWEREELVAALTRGEDFNATETSPSRSPLRRGFPDPARSLLSDLFASSKAFDSGEPSAPGRTFPANKPDSKKVHFDIPPTHQNIKHGSRKGAKMSADLSPRAWFVSLEFHDDHFSRDSIIINTEHIAGCDLLLGSIARVAPFHASKRTHNGRNSSDHSSTVDDSSQYGGTSTSDGTDSQTSKRTASRGTKRTARSGHSVDGDIPGTVEHSKSLVFTVGQLTSEQRLKKPHMQISLHTSIKSVFNFTNRQRAVVYPDSKETSQASFIELAFRDQYLARSDMWQLTVNELSNQPVYRGQQVTFMGSIKAKIKNIFVRKKKVNSALVTASTIPIFRSESARYVFFIQMSREMWEYDADGSGEIMFNKVINGFLPDLFKRWQKAAARHLVSIILFARIEYERGILKHQTEPAYNKRSDPDDKDQKDYRDFYRVVTTDMASGEWIRILYGLKKEFKVFLRDTLILPGEEAYGRLPDTLSSVKDAADVDCVIAGTPTIAAKGNVLEAINLASSQFAQDYIDRDLVRTGISLVIITAGSGVFEVDYDMLKLTTDTLVGNGFGIDLVALSPMPLHSVPLFKYRTPQAARGILAKSSFGSFGRGSATPRNIPLRTKLSASPVKLDHLPNSKQFSSTNEPTNEDDDAESTWRYALPHWIDVSFWTGDEDTSWEDTTASFKHRINRVSNDFIPSVRMYELQMMDLMDIEIADISLPLMEPIIRPVTKASGDSKDSNHHSTDMSRLLNSSNAAAWTPKGSPEKQAPEPEADADLARKLLEQWMDDYDRQVFEDDPGAASMGLTFEKTQKDANTTRSHGRSDSISASFTELGTSPSGSALSRSPLSHFQGLKKPRDRKESMASLVSVPDNASVNSASGLRPTTDGKPDLAKRAKLNRQISLGFKGIGPGKAIASTSISSGSVDMTPATSDMRSTTGTTKPVGLLTQQLRMSLRRKPSEATLVEQSEVKDTKSQKQHQSTPISIQKDSSSESSNDEDSLADATVKPGQLLKPSEYGSTVRPENKFLKTAPGRKDSVGKTRDHELSPWSAMSPWLTLLNPSNPRKDNMSVATQFRRWQHVFPRAIPTTAIKWKSLTSPAALPLTNEYFPTQEELRDQYEEKIHRVQVPEDEDNDLKATDVKSLMRRLISSRFSNGFQLVIGNDAKAHAEVLDLKLIECFEPQLAVDQDSVVLMSIGNDYHQLQCTREDEVLVKRYIRKTAMLPVPVQDSRILYKPRVRTMLAETYTKRSFVLQNPRSTYDWTSIDDHSAGVKPELSEEFRFWRARFVLIPVDIPKGARGSLAPVTEVTDEETRVEGIQKLTQMWQRNRYYPPSEKRYQASLPAQHKDTNPLAIDYQTRDPSAVVRAHALGPVESLLHGGDGFPLFAESNMYHSSDFDLQRVAQHLQSKPPKGIMMVDRRWHFKLYHRCFRGDELTSWILANFKDTEYREDAVRLGNELMKKGLFTHVQSKHHFRDGNYFYQVSSEYRTTSFQDSRGWFSRMTDRSIPTTPSVETNQNSPMSERPASRASKASSGTSSGERTPTKEKVLELSRMLQYDVDPKKKSWRPEIIHLHYDRIHNPDNCYHLRIEWMNVSSKLIEDVIVSWATTVDRYGLKLVEVPIAEACKISEDHPFRTPYRVDLVCPPPKSTPRHYFETVTFSGLHSLDDPLAYQKAVLRKWDFVLDIESAKSFESTVPVTYSWGKPSYQYTQFIHKSGGLLAQITDEGSFLLLANRLCSNRVTPSKDTSKADHPERAPFDRRTTRTAASPYASPLIRPADVPIPPSPHLSALADQRPSVATSRIPTTTSKKDLLRPLTFSETRLNGKPLTAENLLNAFEKFCHNKTELEVFWEDALKPSASPSPRQHPADRASPRVTPTLRGVSAAFARQGRGAGPELGAVEEIPSLGLPERRMQFGAGRAASYAPSSGFGLGPGAGERERERERRESGGGEGRSGALGAQLLGRPASPRDTMLGEDGKKGPGGA